MGACACDLAQQWRNPDWDAANVAAKAKNTPVGEQAHMLVYSRSCVETFTLSALVQCDLQPAWKKDMRDRSEEAAPGERRFQLRLQKSNEMSILQTLSTRQNVSFNYLKCHYVYVRFAAIDSNKF